MRISTTLSLALGVTSCVILASYGLRSVAREEQELRASARHEVELLGAAVKVAVENALRDGQQADVREIFDALELKDAAVDVLVFDAAGELTTRSGNNTSSADLVTPAITEARRTARSVVYFEGHRQLSHLIAALPLRGEDGSNLGVLAVVRPLDVLRQDLSATASSTALSIATVFAGLLAVSWLLVLLHVRRPLESLLVAMRAVRAGDLTASVVEGRKDELGHIAHEFNAMVRELQLAQKSAADESDARRRMELGLARIDKLVTMGQLSAGLAHEIGSPLQVLNGRARALAARQDVSADVRRTAEILSEQSDRITSIVEQLLAVARKKAPQLAETSIAAGISKIVELLTPEARRRAVQVTLSVEDDLPHVWADAERVQQVAMNLLTNALRATPKGGAVRVLVTSSALSTTPAGPPEPSVRVTVENTGPQIPPELIDRIFDPFFTTWQDVGGTGLGLAVVKSILTEHGGTLSVTSNESEGTHFTAQFPIRPASQRFQELSP